MKIKDCSITIKCDVDGCHNKATKGIIFDGIAPQYYMCDDCLKELYTVLKKKYGKETCDEKGKKR